MTQAAIEKEVISLLSQKECSNHRLRVLIVEMILAYLEGTVSLSFVLEHSTRFFTYFHDQLASDVLEALNTLTSIEKQVHKKKPYSFTEHQRIEDRLVTILQQLHSSTDTHTPSSV